MYVDNHGDREVIRYWKSQLSITGRCGFKYISRNGYCDNQSKGTSIEIDWQILKVIGSASPEDRRDELHALAVMVHCPRFHRFNNHLCSTVNSWSTLLPQISQRDEAARCMDDRCDALAVLLDVAQPGCRCPKKDDGMPCKNPPLPASERETTLRRHLMGLESCNIDSDDLEARLYALAKDLNCRQSHSSSEYYEKRVNTWLTTFENLDERTDGRTVEKELDKFLKSISRKITCYYMSPAMAPCDRGIGGCRVLNAHKTIALLRLPEVYCDETTRLYACRVFTLAQLCDDHAWFSDIAATNLSIAIGEVIKEFPYEGKGAKACNIARNPIKDACYAGLSPDAYWPSAPDVSALLVEQKMGRAVTRGEVHRTIQKCLHTPLDKTDGNWGHVYIYHVEGSPDHVKIGYTGKEDVQGRLDQWTFDCNRKAKLLYPVRSSRMTMVPCARRIEALCHAELDYLNELVNCKACLKMHHEWFRITPEAAIAVVRKWTTWMRRGPYVNSVLTQGVELQARNMPKFLADVESVYQLSEDLRRDVDLFHMKQEHTTPLSLSRELSATCKEEITEKVQATFLPKKSLHKSAETTQTSCFEGALGTPALDHATRAPKPERTPVPCKPERLDTTEADLTKFDKACAGQPDVISQQGTARSDPINGSASSEQPPGEQVPSEPSLQLTKSEPLPTLSTETPLIDTSPANNALMSKLHGIQTRFRMLESRSNAVVDQLACAVSALEVRSHSAPRNLALRGKRNSDGVEGIGLSETTLVIRTGGPNPGVVDTDEATAEGKGVGKQERRDSGQVQTVILADRTRTPREP